MTPTTPTPAVGGFTGVYGAAPPYASPRGPAPVSGPTAADPYASASSTSSSGAWGNPYQLPQGPPLRAEPPGASAYWPAVPATAVVPARRRTAGGWVAVLVVLTALLAGSLSFVLARSTTQSITGAPPVRSVPTAPATPGGSSSGGSSSGGTSGGQAPTDPSTSSPSSSDPSSWADVAAVVNPGVVNIESRLDAGIGAGTGIVLTPEGRILTNNHVVDGATEIQVTVASTGEFYDASIVGADPSHDIAVLQLSNASGLATIPLGDSDGVEAGDPIAAIGNAGGRGGTPQIVTGKVVALHQSVTASDQDGSNVETLTDMIQVDAKVVPGDSGGPLADEHGKVIGINTAASASSAAGSGRGRSRTTATPEGYAIPINRALSIADQLAKGGSTPTTTPKSSSGNRGYLGVEVAQSSTADGATINGVKAGSAAQAAGLKAGDVIVGVDGTEITSPSDLTTALSGHKVGDQVSVSWQTSSGQEKQATITLKGA